MNKILNHLNLLKLVVIPLIFFGFYASGQTITKNTTSVVSGTVCPGSSTSYSVSIPSNFGTCKIKWTVTNGAINGADNQQNVSITWNDTPGATSTITVTFSGCTSGNPNEGVTSSKSELILSVKNQAWGSYGSSVNVDYCTKAQVLLTVPRMFVLGTGGIAQPPLTEVAYAWTLPSGWKEVGTNRTGFFGTPTNYITIIPVDCAKPGNVTVYGTLVGAGPFCNSAEKSATATISLNGANPVATVGPQTGYTGSSACNITPVTFYGTTSVALGCISSYNWTYPQSWSLVSQSGNSITLRPSGTSADSNPIRASINFTCGSSITSGNYIPPYTQPIIDGPNLICSSGTFTLQNSSSASVTWTSLNTSVLTINSSGVASRLGSASGSVTIRATLSCNVPPVDKTIWVGTPVVSVESGEYYYEVCATSWFAVSYTPTTEGQGIGSQFWSCTNCDIVTDPYAATINVQAPGSGYFTASVDVTNACGTSPNVKYFVAVDEIDGQPCQLYLTGGGEMELTISPNPTSDLLTIEITNGSSKTSNQTLNVRLVNENQVVVAQESSTHNRLTIETKYLKGGVYYLHCEQGENSVTRRILITH